jgi:hypothetical protein
MTQTPASAASEPPAAPAPVVSALKAFAKRHGGATAVISYLGRRGARIVLVGADGAWGDQVAADPDVARAACDAAGVAVSEGWGRELSEAVRTSGYEWGLMGRNRPVSTGQK